MNRRHRRAQAKGDPPLRGVPQDIREIFETALALHRSGRLQEAENLYRQVLAAAPRHADALHLLGVIARQAGRSDVAVEYIAKAIRINGDVAFYHSNLGNALKDLRRFREAVAAYRTALRLAPDAPDVHNSLGNALMDMTRLDDALAAYQAAIRLKPDFAEAYSNLANALRDMGRLGEAVEAYRSALRLRSDVAEIHFNLGVALRDMGLPDEALVAYENAIRLRPDYAEAHNNRGNALRQLGRLDGAAEAYRAAIRARPDLAEPHNNLGGTLKDLGRPVEAVGAYQAAIARRPDYAEAYGNLGVVLCESGNPRDGLASCERSLKLGETTQAKLGFAECLARLAPPALPDGSTDLALRALREGWCKPGKLTAAVAATARKRLHEAGIDDDHGNAPECLAGEPLLQCLMRLAPIHDEWLERVLTACRAGFLARAADDTANAEFAGPLAEFFCALADQCFVNEFVFDMSPDEEIAVERLETKILSALEIGAPVHARELIALGCYVPLHSLPGAGSLLDIVWAGPVRRTLELQVAEPAVERSLAAEIPTLTAIDVGVSAQVRQQYEENPYPRWVRTEPQIHCPSVEAHIRNQIPHAPIVASGRATADILIAGCGTGLHPIETAQIFPDAKILAIDLSRTSLAYAARKARELAIGNLEFAQADILRLGAIGRHFDAIESVGVLHHLAEPEAGLSVLVAMLRPRGFLRLGLYSERARRNVVAARRFIADRRFHTHAADIRRCRRELRALDRDDLVRTVANWDDFASVSGCRDLLFNIQEHRLTLPAIKSSLDRLGLVFLGFDIAPAISAAFRLAYPEPGAEVDLDRWDAFEDRNPDIFGGMYQFWVQKRD